MQFLYNFGEKMKKACRYCGKIHEKNYICSHKPIKQKSYTDLDKFRSSKQWQLKRKAIAERDLHLCRACLAGLFVPDGKPLLNSDVEVHHITPLAVDFKQRLDDENLISLCHYHHELAENGSISAEELRELLTRPVSYDPQN